MAGAVSDLFPNDDYDADRRNFLLGEDSDKENFIKRYGVDRALEARWPTRESAS